MGISITFLDALFFTSIKHRHGGNVWASVMAHGTNNTIGLLAFYFWGPFYGLW